MATKTVGLTLNINELTEDKTSTAWVSGKTVYGHTVTASTSVVQESAEIVQTYEIVRTEQTYATVINRTDIPCEISYISIQLLNGTTVLSTWLYENISVDSKHSTTTPTTGLSIGEKQILTNTTLDVEISVPYTYATGADKMTFQFPEWSAFGGSSIEAYMQGESFYGKKSLPILERAPGDVYVFPNTNFTITFE